MCIPVPATADAPGLVPWGPLALSAPSHEAQDPHLLLRSAHRAPGSCPELNEASSPSTLLPAWLTVFPWPQTFTPSSPPLQILLILPGRGVEVLSTGLWERPPELKSRLGPFPAGGPGAASGTPWSPTSSVASGQDSAFTPGGRGLVPCQRPKSPRAMGMAKSTFLLKLIKFTILTSFKCTCQWQ